MCICHPCYSLRPEFQPNWSKYKFLPYLGILFGPEIHIFENYLYRYMCHPCLSLHTKFQPNWSKYKFLPYLGILSGPKNTYIRKLPLQVHASPLS